jgi:hypothetical protein
MSKTMMSPLPTFTLESLVTEGQWVAAQNNSRRKADAKSDEKKDSSSTDPSTKASKPTL